MGELPGSVQSVVVGAGHAGLIVSRLLRQAGREHIVLERRTTLGGGWQDRWDAFQLVTPNFLTDLPDYPYGGGDPDGFMSRDEIIRRTADYARVIDAPVVVDTAVTRLSAAVEAGGGSARGVSAGGSIARGGSAVGARRFRVKTPRGTVLADHVVLATGAFHRPKIPAEARFGPGIAQLHAQDYRNPAALPDGGVLVVGSGQTGVQLAEELHESGRRVTLSVGHCGRAPRRYRGHDYFWWIRQLVLHGDEIGVPLPDVQSLPDPRARFACNPHLSGHGGGHDANLRQFALDGIRLVGRFQGADDDRARFAPDLAENLHFADAWFDERFRPMFDRYAERAGLDVGPDDRVSVDHDVPEVTELDLAAEGISTVLWTTGFAPDYAWLDLPVLGPFGVPEHVRGVTTVPGLECIGLLWQRNNASANLAGVAADAEYLATRWS